VPRVSGVVRVDLYWSFHHRYMYAHVIVLGQLTCKIIKRLFLHTRSWMGEDFSARTQGQGKRDVFRGRLGGGVRVFLLHSPTKSIPYIRCLQLYRALHSPGPNSAQKVHTESTIRMDAHRARLRCCLIQSELMQVTQRSACDAASDRLSLASLIGNARIDTYRIVNCINCGRLFLVLGTSLEKSNHATLYLETEK
jgi:hypothetical protein